MTAGAGPIPCGAQRSERTAAIASRKTHSLRCAQGFDEGGTSSALQRPSASGLAHSGTSEDTMQRLLTQMLWCSALVACADDPAGGNIDLDGGSGSAAGGIVGSSAADSDGNECARARSAYDAFVAMHNQCSIDDDCAAVASRFNCTIRLFKFAAVHRSYRDQAEQLAVAPCRGGGGTDGPVYGRARCVAGRCEAVVSGNCQVRPDGGL